MQNQIFRKKSLDRVSSPDQLDDYIHVTSPSVWIIFAAIVVLLIGACIWGIMGYLDTTATVAAYADPAKNQLVLYIKEKDAPYVHPGTVFKLNGQEYAIEAVDAEHYRLEMAGGIDPILLEYTMHVGNLVSGEWVNCAYAAQKEPLNEGIYEASVILEHVHPMSFILN